MKKCFKFEYRAKFFTIDDMVDKDQLLIQLLPENV